MPNIGTSPDTHLLETLLYFAPNFCQVVYMEPQSLTHLSPLASSHQPSLPPPLPPPPPGPPPPPLPPPPLLSSCLVPLGHRYCRCCCFCCSLLIVVCPCLCHCRRLCRLCRHRWLCFSTATATPLLTVVVMIVFVITAAVVIIVIEVVVPVAVVNNDAMPSPRCSLRRRSLPSLLSQCFLQHH